MNPGQVTLVLKMTREHIMLSKVHDCQDCISTVNVCKLFKVKSWINILFQCIYHKRLYILINLFLWIALQSVCVFSLLLPFKAHFHKIYYFVSRAGRYAWNVSQYIIKSDQFLWHHFKGSFCLDYFISSIEWESHEHEDAPVVNLTLTRQPVVPCALQGAFGLLQHLSLCSLTDSTFYIFFH